MQPDVEYQIVKDSSSGRIHEAIRVHGGEPMLHDACNVVGERVYLSDFPDDTEDSDLCKRCFG